MEINVTRPLVTFEVVAYRDEDARANRGWQLDTAGVFRMHHNSDDAVRPVGADLFWFDTPLPAAPIRRLDATIMDRVRVFLATLEDLPPRTERLVPRMEGGSRYRATFLTAAGPRIVEVDSPERAFLDDLMRPLLAVVEVP